MAMGTRFRTTLASGNISETTAFDYDMTRESKITICALSASTNSRITIYYIFHEDVDGVDEQSQVQQIDLTQNVLTIVNFDFPMGTVRVTYDDSASMSGGALRIDARAV